MPIALSYLLPGISREREELILGRKKKLHFRDILALVREKQRELEIKTEIRQAEVVEHKVKTHKYNKKKAISGDRMKQNTA